MFGYTSIVGSISGYGKRLEQFRRVLFHVLPKIIVVVPLLTILGEC